MLSSRTLILLHFLALLGLALIFGCGSDDATSPVPEDGPAPIWTDALALPDDDLSTYLSVVERLFELREQMGIALARDSLLVELETMWPRVAESVLATDGTSIDLQFIDGVSAGINTDENAFGPLTEDEKEYKGTGRLFLGEIGCDDIVVPLSRKVHIVNLAGSSNPESHDYISDLKEYLLSLGWDEGDVDISQRANYNDCSITPDTIFEQDGYGMVLFIAHGGFRYDESGQEHFTMQAFRGGDFEDGYQDHITQDRWDDYKQWKQEGKLLVSSAYCAADSSYQRHISMRDDLLAENLQLDEGAMVSFISCNSIALDGELTEAGAGSVLAWDGSMNGPDGLDAWKNLIYGMATEDGPGSDAATLDWMHDRGAGYSTGHWGEQTTMQRGGAEGDFYLPAWGEVITGEDCFPDLTDHIEVDITYPDCPEENQHFTTTPGSLTNLDRLLPIGGEVRFKAKDSSGNTLAGGWYDLDWHGGLNFEELCPCTGTLDLDPGDVPVDGDNTATTMDIDLSWDDPTLPPLATSFILSMETIIDLIPGTATGSAIIRNHAGDVLGTTTITVDVPCEAVYATVCFGWLAIELANYPPDTEYVTVTVPSGLPETVDITPGEVVNVYGFGLGDVVPLTAEAFNSVGTSLEVVSTQGSIADCGPNSLPISLGGYGILLTASPVNRPADGASTSTVTAVLRSWQDGDEQVPTGPPLAGKLVEFDSSVGFFVGDAFGTSDAQGEVTVFVASNEAGVASVRAFVMEDLVESPVAFVNFDRRMSWYIKQSSDPLTSSGLPGIGTFEVQCVRVAVSKNNVQYIERDFGVGSYWGLYFINSLSEGDTIRLRATAHAEWDQCLDVNSSISEVWLHTIYEPDLQHQAKYRFTSGVDPLTGTRVFEVVIEEIEYYRGAKKRGEPDYFRPPADVMGFELEGESVAKPIR